MQDMLAQVRAEMEELQNSRDFWEDRALSSDNEIQSLQSSVEEWREEAIQSESKVNELETELSATRKELEKCRIDPNRVSVIPEELDSSPLSKKLEQEKHKLVCHIRGGAGKEMTHKDVGNLLRPNSNVVLPINCHEPLKTNEIL